MKVLLVAVNAKYIHSNLAVYDLKAYTENIPVELELAEYTINQQQEEMLRDIYEHKADVVAFSCYIWNITYVKALAEELHKIDPQVQIWFGGPEASYDAKQLLRECAVHSVPLSMPADNLSAVSWGIDPPLEITHNLFGQPESWRTWVSRHIAVSLRLISTLQLEPYVAITCAVKRLEMALKIELEPELPSLESNYRIA